jgi:hypothetical protein
MTKKRTMIKLNKIIKNISAVILITTLSSCMLFLGKESVTSPTFQVDNPQNETEYFITECNSIKKSNKFGYQNIRFQTYTFSSEVLVYCSPMENSRVVDTISVNEEVRGRRTITNNNVLWLEIYHEGKTRYIKRADTRIEGYFFSMNDILIGRKNDSVVSIKVIGIETNNELDSYDFETPINKKADSNSTYLINRTKLIGGKYIIRHQTYKDEKYKDVIINEFVLLDNRKQFVSLLNSRSYTYKNKWVDDFEKESIFIPCRFEHEKILLVENGDLDNIFNKQTGKLNVIDCPKRFKKFEENLIVKKIESRQDKLDENGELMFDDEGDQIYIETREIIYYQWNGTKLVEVK